MRSRWTHTTTPLRRGCPVEATPGVAASQPEPQAQSSPSPQRPEEEARQCPECKAARLLRDPRRGEIVCEACGLVLEEGMVDPGPEWRSFDREQDERRARTGAPATFLLHDKGLSTYIGFGNRDSQGRTIPQARRAVLQRMRRWQRRLRASSNDERNLMAALASMDRTASRMALPRNVRETAAVTYRRALGADLVRGRSIEGIAAASLYAACRRLGVPRTLDEVADASLTSRKALGRDYRIVARALRLGLGPTSPLEYIPRFASRLNMGEQPRARAADLIRRAEAKGALNGKPPASTAGAALYIASLLEGEPRTQQDVAEAAGVTEVTIRTRAKDFSKTLGITLHRDPAKSPSPSAEWTVADVPAV